MTRYAVMSCKSKGWCLLTSQRLFPKAQGCLQGCASCLQSCKPTFGLSHLLNTSAFSASRLLAKCSHGAAGPGLLAKKFGKFLKPLKTPSSMFSLFTTFSPSMWLGGRSAVPAGPVPWSWNSLSISGAQWAGLAACSGKSSPGGRSSCAEMADSYFGV